MWFVSGGNTAGQRLGRAVGQPHRWLAAGEIHYPHVAPVNAPGNAGSQGFRAGFLGGEALGVGRSALRPAVGFGAFDFGEAAVGEPVAVLPQHLLDTRTDAEVVAAPTDH